MTAPAPQEKKKTSYGPIHGFWMYPLVKGAYAAYKAVKGLRVDVEGLEHIPENEAALILHEHHHHWRDAIDIAVAGLRAGHKSVVPQVGLNLLGGPVKPFIRALPLRPFPRIKERGALVEKYGEVLHDMDDGHHIWIASTPGLVRDGKNNVVKNIFTYLQEAGSYNSIDELFEDRHIVVASNNADRMLGYLPQARRDAKKLQFLYDLDMFVFRPFIEHLNYAAHVISEPIKPGAFPAIADNAEKTAAYARLASTQMHVNRAFFAADLAAYNMREESAGRAGLSLDGLSKLAREHETLCRAWYQGWLARDSVGQLTMSRGQRIDGNTPPSLGQAILAMRAQPVQYALDDLAAQGNPDPRVTIIKRVNEYTEKVERLR